MSVRLSSIRLIAMREWRHRVRERSFRITTIVLMVAMIALILAPVLISAVTGDDDDDSATRVTVLDRTEGGVVDALNAYAADAGLGSQIAFEAGAADADPVALVDDDDAPAVLTVEEGTEGIAFTYTSDDGALGSTASLVYAAVGDLTVRDGLTQAGLDADAAAQVRTTPDLTLVAASDGAADSEGTEQAFRYGVAYAAALMMYMVVLIYGMWVAQGVVEEKSSRIMEIMINAATPTELMFGKVIGIGLSGLTQLAPLLLVAIVGLLSQERLADALDVSGLAVSGVDFGSITAVLAVFFLVYFILGFLLYAALYAGVGSLVSRQEDVQTAMTPMTLAVVVGFFAAIFTLGAPDSTLARVAAIVPFTSPMTMVPRILLGDPAAWEIALSIALLAVTVVVAVVLAGRIYRMGVLLYGQKPSMKMLFRSDLISAPR